MCLPVLLFVTGLMVNLGTVTAWRVRGEIVARDAAWRTRYPRTGANEPRPEDHVWPDEATIGVVGEEDANQIDELDDPEIDHEVARGPLAGDWQVTEVLKPNQGAFRGEASIEREYVFLKNLGRFESGSIKHPLLDGKWSNADMGVPRNTYRRTLILYELPQTDPSLPQAYIDTVISIVTAASFADVRILDHDAEVRQYRGGYADFHPRIRTNRCTIDVEEVYEEEVERLIDTMDEEGRRIPGLISLIPARMARYYISMYQTALQDDPPNSAELEMYIQQLQEFLEQLEDE
jgi:hypothetical protein